MDGAFTWDYYLLINELTQGMEHTKQLRTYLSSVPSTSEAIPELLLQKILSSYEQSLLILKWSGSPVQSLPAARSIESKVSGDGNPRSDDKKRSSEDHQKLIHISKRRKSQFLEQVRFNAKSEVEGPPDDGYSWRKYGQKDIFGAKFPRGYYRCTFRHIDNCLATKQMQRSDVDPTGFEITYRGYHTCQCHQVTNSILQAASPGRQASHHSLIDDDYSPYFVGAEGGFDSFEGPIDGGYSSIKFEQKDIRGAKYLRKSQFFDQVRVKTESEVENPQDDGYSWRKYGQKDVLGAKFPRGYYRCTFRYIENCLATKQMQRSDVDPTGFEITYKGYHTCQCHQVTNSILQATLPERQASHHSLIGGDYSPYFVGAEGGFDSFEGPIDGGYSWIKFGQKDILGAKYPRSYYRCTYGNMKNCRATKQVQRSDDDPTAFEIIYRGSHTCHLATNSALQATSPGKEASQHSLIVGRYSPSFVSPTTPESNYFSVSSFQMNDLGIVHNLDHSESYLSDIGMFLDLHHSDSDRTDISANTSTTSSSMGGEFARLSGGRPDFSIWTKRHPQTEAITPQKDDKGE
ncbi:hypothetical protein AABB24_013870 [Solanum stoloniferum]|uniref:WRKY domain-containing protein n=2 Tax=Solanum TaxID=4107 RepID=A0ABD2TYU8_9SOLN